MKKMSKKILSFALVVMMLISMVSPVMAAITQPNGVTGNSTVETGKIEELGNSILSILTTIGMIVSVIVLVVLGIKYMMGSAEEKAEYKKTLMPYIMGAGLVFAASAIAQMVYTFAHSAITNN